MPTRKPLRRRRAHRKTIPTETLILTFLRSCRLLLAIMLTTSILAAVLLRPLSAGTLLKASPGPAIEAAAVTALDKAAEQGEAPKVIYLQGEEMENHPGNKHQMHPAHHPGNLQGRHGHVEDNDAYPTSWNNLKAHHVVRFGLLALIVVAFFAVGLKWDIKLKDEAKEVPKVGGVPAALTFMRQSSSDANKVVATVPLPTIWPKFTRLHSSTRYYVLTGSMGPDSWSTAVHNVEGVATMVAGVVHRTRGRGRALEILSDGLGRMVFGSLEFDGFEMRGMAGTVLGQFVAEADGRIALVRGDGKELCTIGGAPWGSFAEARSCDGKVGIDSNRRNT